MSARLDHLWALSEWLLHFCCVEVVGADQHPGWIQHVGYGEAVEKGGVKS